ncbi:MAG: sulfurtransferase TusA family protein [Thermoplasmata archaeon]
MVVEDETFDARGMFCPEPVMKLAECMKHLRGGMVLKLLADDPASYEDIKAWCRRTGNELVEITEEGGVVTAYIRKK